MNLLSWIRVVFMWCAKVQMKLVDKPGCKSAVWKYFGLKCDEEKCPVIDGHAFCPQYKKGSLSQWKHLKPYRSSLK